MNRIEGLVTRLQILQACSHPLEATLSNPLQRLPETQGPVHTLAEILSIAKNSLWNLAQHGARSEARHNRIAYTFLFTNFFAYCSHAVTQRSSLEFFECF